MAFSFFLKLASIFLHHFAWPLLALGYPMCASVQAIETDSYEETRDLISYWILLSLVYLFDYAFIKLLLWFQFWPYIKLMVIFWLVIPDFGRASYVYNSLIRFIKQQIVACNLSNYWRNVFVEKENFLLQAERYMKDNGTEALEKLIASKVNNYGVISVYKPDAEATNAVRAADNKEMQQIKGKMLQTEQEGTKVLEVIEKKEIAASKQAVPVMPITVPSQNVSSAIVEKTTRVAGKDTASGEVCQSSASTHKEVQKEWTCALCQVTTSSEIDLESHLKGRRHWNTLEALKAQKQSTQQIKGNMLQTEQEGTKVLEVIEKKEIAASKQEVPVMPITVPSQNVSSAIVEKTTRVAWKDTASGEVCQSSASTHKEVQKEWTCALCQVTTSSEMTLESHLKGRRHWDTLEALKAQKQSTQQKLGISKSKEELKQKSATNQQSFKADNGLKGTLVMDHKVQKPQENLSKGILVMDRKVQKPQQNSSKGILGMEPKVQKLLQNSPTIYFGNLTYK